MKIKANTYPNIFWCSLYLIMLLLIALPLYFIFKIILKSHDYKFLFIEIIFIGLLILIYFQISNFFSFISINSSHIKILQPLKLKYLKIKLDEIGGYSLSEFYIGSNPSLLKSKSFIIYPKTSKPIEIIKMFNINFTNILFLIKKSEIVKFGSEPYVTGFILRKYKYNYLIKKTQ